MVRLRIGVISPRTYDQPAIGRTSQVPRPRRPPLEMGLCLGPYRDRPGGTLGNEGPDPCRSGAAIPPTPGEISAAPHALTVAPGRLQRGAPHRRRSGAGAL